MSLAVPPSARRIRWRSPASSSAVARRRVPLEGAVKADGPHRSRRPSANDGGAHAEGPADLADPPEHHARHLAGVGQPGAGRDRGAAPGGGAGAGDCGDLVEDPGPDGDRPHPVGQGVVQLDQDGERPAVRPADEVHPPGRQAPAERSLHQFTGQPGGLRHEVAVGRDDAFDMPVHVEALVHRPGLAADRQQDVPYAHAQPGDRGGAGPEQVENLLRTGAGRRGEDGERAQVHRMGIRFEVPESQIERGEKLGTQRGPLVVEGGRAGVRPVPRSQSFAVGYGQAQTCYVLLRRCAGFNGPG